MRNRAGNNYDGGNDPYPKRIVCLTEETTETLYLLGEGDRIVGISGYTVRPPEARSKPKVSAFINARFDKIEALEPDLVLAFSDLQADIAAELIRRGFMVLTFNQRSIAEIFQMIRMVGALVGRCGSCGRARRVAHARSRRDPRARRSAAAPSACLLRGMGRPADLRASAGWRSWSRLPAAIRSSQSCGVRAWRRTGSSA